MCITINRRITILCIFALMCLFLTACASVPASDPKRNSSWQAPERFDVDTVFNAALKALAQLDTEISSTNRQAGIISTNKVVPLPLISIPSQLPITFTISKVDSNVTLSTTAYLKGMGTAGMYENTINDFYDALFLELKIQNSDEKLVNHM